MIPGIQEIKALALKYSKKQLANMAQTGLIDPQKAVMAGMMRDRIAKEDMQPPTSTVAQDALGLAPAPQIPPQMGMQPQPQMAQGQMPPPQMGAPVQQPPVMAASGGVTSLPVDIADYAGGGIVAFADRGLVEDEAIYDPVTGVQISGPAPKPYRREMAPGTIYEPSLLSDVFLGPIESTTVAPATATTTTTTTPPVPAPAPAPAPAVPQRRSSPDGATTSRGPGTPKAPAASSILPPPDLPTDKPYIQRPDIPELPKLPAFDPNMVRIQGEDLPIYTARERKDIGAARRAAEVEEGVDPEMYSKMIKGVEEKKGKLEKRRGEMGGEALMQFGLGLIGARKGEEFQTISKSAKEALGAYKQDVKDLRAAEEKYDERIEALRMSDQQAKLTGARADIAQSEQDKQLAFNSKVEVAKAKNALATSNATLNAQLRNTQAQYELGGYQTGVRATTELHQADQQAASKHFSDILGAKVQLHTALQQARTAEEGHKIQLQIAQLNNETQRWIHSRPPAEIQAIDAYAKKTGKPWEQAARDFYQMRGGTRTTYTREEAMKDARKNLENRGILNPTDAQMQEEIEKNLRIYGGGGGGNPTAGWGQMTVH